MHWSTGIVIFAVVCGIRTSGAREILQQEAKKGLAVSYVPEFPQYPVESVDFSHVITLQAPEAISKSDRAPVALTVVLDRSGSMVGNKIELVKKSTDFLVQQLQEGDAIGVVSYSNTEREDFPLTPVTSNSKKEARGSIREIIAQGSTNLSGGLFKGIEQQLGYSASPKSVNTVLLLTDGLPTDGIQDLPSIRAKMGVELDTAGAPTVYTLGFGLDHDAEFLRGIAKSGEGAYVFIEDEAAVGSSFGEILGGLLTVTAQNIKVTLTPLNGASIVSMKGGEVSPGEESWITNFKDLFAEERRDILVNMRIPATSGPTSSQSVLQATIEYFDISRGKEAKDKISVVLARQPGVKKAPPATLVEVTRLRNRVAEDIATAVKAKESGDSQAATATLDSTLERIATSSESSDPEVQTLAEDVQTVKDEVSAEEELSRADAISFASGSASLAEQRTSGSASLQKLKSKSTTTSAAAFSSAGAAFVNGGGR